MTTATHLTTKTAPPAGPHLDQLDIALSQARSVLAHLASRFDDPGYEIVIRGAEKESLRQQIDTALSELDRAQRTAGGAA